MYQKIPLNARSKNRTNMGPRDTTEGKTLALHVADSAPQMVPRALLGFLNAESGVSLGHHQLHSHPTLKGKLFWFCLFASWSGGST